MVSEREQIGMGIAFLTMCLAYKVYETASERSEMERRLNTLKKNYEALGEE